MAPHQMGKRQRNITAAAGNVEEMQFPAVKPAGELQNWSDEVLGSEGDPVDTLQAGERNAVVFRRKIGTIHDLVHVQARQNQRR